MKSKSAEKIKMPSIDELLGVSGEESATDIEISRIHSFANHPFKVLDDDKMDDLVKSNISHISFQKLPRSSRSSLLYYHF